jgi:pimeloyl-ACP methyl ester carboxylesterase
MPNICRVPDVELAYEFLPGTGPVVVFCPGYASDMQGSKALALEIWCKQEGRALLRFDYAGHGASGGRFIDGCVGDWAADAAFIVEQVLPGQEIVLVGSSMGGWISLLIGRQMGERLRGLLLIAPAPDFTEALIRPQLSAAALETLRTEGVIYPPSAYGEPLPLTVRLLEDGAEHLLLGGPIHITCPVRILHGMRDADVPWDLSLKLVNCLESEDVHLTYVKAGDHRLSTPEDLALLCRSLGALLSQDGA